MAGSSSTGNSKTGATRTTSSSPGAVPTAKTIIACGPLVRVEQKNGDVVCKTVGYHRFEGQEMHDALEAVYRCLNPLLNYWYPTLRLVAKEKLASGRYKKIYEKVPT
jgi:hypothetical protein